MSTPRFLPYSTQTISQADIDAVTTTLTSGYLTQGPAVPAFEKALAESVGAEYAVAVANGTVALHIAYLAAGIGEGDEVITTPLTFAATANAALYCGATPVLADIRPDTGGIDPDAVKTAITPKTKAIVSVDFAGIPADLAALRALADQHNLVFISDGAHSLGATYQGKPVGSGDYADMTMFSFHPVKPITTGEGGVITTNNRTYYDTMCQLRTHGITKDPQKLSQQPGPWYYEMQDLGFNYRLPDIQAALGSSQLTQLDTFITKRQAIAKQYDEAFANCRHIDHLKVPEDRTSGTHLYVLQVDFDAIGQSRSEVMVRLREKGIGTQVHYIPIHHHPYYQQRGFSPSDFPIANAYYSKALSIPVFPTMTDEDVTRVIDAILELDNQ